MYKKNRMSKYSINRIYISIIILIVSSCSWQNPSTSYPVKQGRVDLSGLDVHAPPVISLCGDWKFKYLAPHSAYGTAGFFLDTWELLSVPGSWNSLTNRSFGHGWVTVTLENLTAPSMGLYIPECISAYRLYINGVEYQQVGFPGENRRQSSPDIKPKIIALPRQQSLSIALFISNYFEYYNGLTAAPMIGKTADLYKLHYFQDIRDIFIIGIIFIMALFHLILYLLRKQEIAALFFSFFCFNGIVRICVVNRYLTRLINAESVFFIQNKLEYLTLPLCCLTYLLFYKNLFAKTTRWWVDKIIIGLCVLSCATIIFFPAWIYTGLLYSYKMLVLFTSAAVLVYTACAVYRKLAGARMLLVSYLVFTITLIGDMVFALKPVETGYMVQYGFLCLFFTVLLIFLIRFARALQAAESFPEHLARGIKQKTRQIRLKAKRHKELYIFFYRETKTSLNLLNTYFTRYLKKVPESGDLLVIKRCLNLVCSLMHNLDDCIRFEKRLEGKDIINISAVVQKKILFFRHTGAAKKILLDSQIESGLYIRADKPLLDRVVHNLLANRIHSIPPGGTITITVQAEGPQVVFSLQDSGGRRAGGDGKQRTRGDLQQRSGFLGSGLSIVQGIVESLAAGIELHSRPEEGTLFKIRFNLYRGEKAEQAPGLSVCDLVPAAGGLDKPVVMVVEDNRETASVLQKALEKKYCVFCAANSRKALIHLKLSPRPELIIGAVEMGGSVLRSIKHDDELKGIPVIVLADPACEETKIKALSEGAVDYIVKPVNLEELMSKIDALIQNRESLKKAHTAKMKQKISSLLDEADTKNFPGQQYRLFCKKYGITEKEEAVLQRLLQGLATKEIAYELDISINTIKKRIASIFRKSDVQNRIELMNKL